MRQGCAIIGDDNGHDGFAEYVDMVHEALGEYRCHVEALVEEDNQVFARMLLVMFMTDAVPRRPLVLPERVALSMRLLSSEFTKMPAAEFP